MAIVGESSRPGSAEATRRLQRPSTPNPQQRPRIANLRKAVEDLGCVRRRVCFFVFMFRNCFIRVPGAH